MKRHLYRLTHQNIVPGRIGQIIPTLRMEVIPGDSFQGRIGVLVRFKGFAAPVLTPTYLDYYMFYVPNRLVWNDKLDENSWEDFITGTETRDGQATGPVGTQTDVTSNIAPPTLDTNDAFLSNYSQFHGAENALYVRGYNLIYNNFFRDEDYPEVNITTNGSYLDAFQLRNQYNEMRDDTATFQEYAEIETLAGPYPPAGDYVGSQSMRDAMRRQRFAERREMFGDRYIDVLRSYGVRTNFNMLERPEPLGKSRHVVSFTDIPATADSGGITVGDLAGHGIVGLHHRMPRKTFNEHGYLHGVIVVRPSQFINTLSPYDAQKNALNDYWAPEWEAETAQPIKEALISSGGSTVDQVGYVPKFQEYRKTNNFIQSHYGGTSTWGNEWTFEQTITSAHDNEISEQTRKVNPDNYDDAFNSTTDTEPHFRALVHNGITSYRLVGTQSRI